MKTYFMSWRANKSEGNSIQDFKEKIPTVKCFRSMVAAIKRHIKSENPDNPVLATNDFYVTDFRRVD